MADKKISELAAASALDTDDLLAVVEDGTTKKATIQDILDLAPSGNGIPTVINAVTDYGAAGDGTTNDLTALDNALSAADAQGGGIVYLPEGDYKIGTTSSTGDVLEVPANVTLRGAGRQATIIRSASTQTGVRPLSFVSGATNARIESLSLVANSTTTASCGMQFKDNQHCVIDDCYISADFGWGVQTQATCYYTVVSNTEIAGTTGQNCYENNGGSYNTVVGCHLHDSVLQLIENGDKTDVGWASTQDPDGVCVGNQFLNNWLVDAGGGAMQMMGDKGTVISGNIIVGAGTHGIHVDAAEWPLDDSIPAEGLTIANNIIRGCTSSGITLAVAAETCTITGNTIEGTLATGSGIETYGGEATIIGNICRLNGGHGMHIVGDRSTIIGNLCLNNSGTGVQARHGIMIDTADYCKVIGNVCSDDRGASKRQDLGTFVNSATGVALIANGGTGNYTSATYDGGTSTSRSGNEGAATNRAPVFEVTTLGSGGAYVGSAGEALSLRSSSDSIPVAIVYNLAQTPNVNFMPDGRIDLQASLARLNFNNAAHSQTTVGAAGGASALPATPTKYVKVYIQGTDYVIPAYAPS